MAPPPAFKYIQSDIPEGVSIQAWRRAHSREPARRRRLRAILQRARRGLRL